MDNRPLEEQVTQQTAELQRLSDALQIEINERTRAEQSLRDADHRKNKSLAALVHELRNPLAPLATALQLIAAEPQNLEQVRELVQMMSQQLDRLARLIDDLAAVSRINSGDLRSPSDLTNSAPSIPAAPDEGEPQPLPGLKVFLVDDNQSATHMMSRLLQRLGQQVYVANSGLAALALMSRVAPDIVISDVAMPGMSGYDLARQIRQLDLPHRPYLVAVTGFGQESDRQAALAAGFDKHLIKPIGVQTLEELLRSSGGRA